MQYPLLLSRPFQGSGFSQQRALHLIPNRPSLLGTCWEAPLGGLGTCWETPLGVWGLGDSPWGLGAGRLPLGAGSWVGAVRVSGRGSSTVSPPVGSSPGSWTGAWPGRWQQGKWGPAISFRYRVHSWFGAVLDSGNFSFWNIWGHLENLTCFL